MTPNTSLAGKVAIVTGGSRGIGAATAVELAKRGAKIAITYVSLSSEILAEKVIEEIKALANGSSAIKILADARDVSSPAKIVEEMIATFGPSIDILVNNAGKEYGQTLGNITVEDYADVMDVNVWSVILMTQAVLPHLRSPGRIINIGSVLARFGNPASSVYLASKVALEALARGWAAELGAMGHTVNVVAPALTETDMIVPNAEQFVQMQKMMTPLGHRLGKAEDIALCVAMIADAASQWITGQTIQAGGGIYMT